MPLKLNKHVFPMVFTFVFLFHTMRNLTVLYVPLLTSFYMIAIFSFANSRCRFQNSSLAWTYLIFTAMTFYVAAMSVVESGVNSLNGIPRLFLAPMLVFALILFFSNRDNKDIVHKLMGVYVFIFVIGALSLIFQLSYGPISWLAAQGQRSGLDRYATTLGSLTIYGTACGIPLVYVSGSKFGVLTKFVLILLIVVGALLSLQKAAIVNLALAFLVIVFFFVSGRRKWNAIIAMAMLLLVSGTLLRAFQGSTASLYVDGFLVNSVGFQLFSDTELVPDDAISVDEITGRIGGLGLDVLENFSIVRLLILGLGVFGGGGGMGVEGIQAHNSYWDIVLMGGVFYLLTFILFFYFLQRRLYSIKSELGVFFFYSNFIFAINASFASAFIYQPVTSFPFWLSVLYALTSDSLEARERA